MIPQHSLRENVGSPHVDSLVFVILSAVRGEGPVVHFLERDVLDCKVPAPCGALPSMTGRGTVRWKSAKPGGKICNTCHAFACSKPSRIEWAT